MPRYQVHLKQTVSQLLIVEVEADSEDDVKRIVEKDLHYDELIDSEDETVIENEIDNIEVIDDSDEDESDEGDEK